MTSIKSLSEVAPVIANWPLPARCHALTTTRVGGVSTGPYQSLNLGDHVHDQPELVKRNRHLLQTQLSLPGEPLWLEQVHGTTVADADDVAAGVVPVADAAVTRRTDRVLAVMTADCLPVVLCDPQRGVIAIAHAGWRGLAGGVLEACVVAMATSPQRIHAWLGPAIGPDHFEVGPEVRERFVALDSKPAMAGSNVPASDSKSVFAGSDGAASDTKILVEGSNSVVSVSDRAGCFSASAKTGHYLADLYALARLALRDIGVNSVSGQNHCTFGEPERFYSYRRDHETGRMVTLAWISGKP